MKQPCQLWWMGRHQATGGTPCFYLELSYMNPIPLFSLSLPPSLPAYLSPFPSLPPHPRPPTLSNTSAVSFILPARPSPPTSVIVERDWGNATRGSVSPVSLVTNRAFHYSSVSLRRTTPTVDVNVRLVYVWRDWLTPLKKTHTQTHTHTHTHRRILHVRERLRQCFMF